MVFDPNKLTELIKAKAKKALGRSLADGIVDLQSRLDSGKGTNGKSYKYSASTAKKKGKSSPVDWNETGTLRRSIDFDILEREGNLTGRIGIKDIGRGKTSNLEILKSLIKYFPSMWGLSKKEKENLIENFKKAYK